MVIISTRAVEVSIHAVSPELILSVPIKNGSVGAGAAAAAGAADAAAARRVIRPRSGSGQRQQTDKSQLSQFIHQ